MGRFYLLAFAVLAALAILPSEAQEARFFAIGTEATLMCSWSGLDNPSDIELVRWTKKGKRIRGPRYEIGNSEFNHTMTIKSVIKSDKGSYFCSPKVSSKSNITLADGQIVVSVGKASIPEPPEAKEISVTEGGSLEVNCNYNSERYDLKQFWTYNGEKFKDDDTISEGIQASYETYTDDGGRDWLKLSSLDTEATGVYKCNYRYPDKQVFSMTFNVAVTEAEGPDDFVRNMTLKEDHFSGTLICDLSSLENATISRFYWTKDGAELMNNIEKHVIKANGTVRSLEIKKLSKEVDEGVYRCVAQLKYFPIAVRFNVMIEKSRMDIDFTEWTEWSACDSLGRRFRFRTCTDEGCLDRYGSVYNVGSENCSDEY